MEFLQIKSLIFGHAIGDALGVPVEFESREELMSTPVEDMRGYGSYPVPAGAWSDDTSMTLCLMDSLVNKGKIDYADIMDRFVRWYKKAEYTPTGVMFDIGAATRHALLAYAPDSIIIPKTEPLLCGGNNEYDNGNGSLMRIAPLSVYFYAQHGTLVTSDDMRELHEISMLTHAHPRSLMACGIYLLIAVRLLDNANITKAIGDGLNAAHNYYARQSDFAAEVKSYERLWNINEFAAFTADSIKSSGYVVDTLEAALWCLLTTDSYRTCVLKAVNLGDDTDTVGAIAGGLAGLAYGWKNIPQEWKDGILRADFIEDLCRKFYTAINQ